MDPRLAAARLRQPDQQSCGAATLVMARTIMDLQEADGSWWDYPFYDYHQPYGTAFALMTLYRCRAADAASE